MATLKPKAKNKKPGRAAKSDARNHDLSNLRQPIETSISNLRELAKLFETATPEIKDLLTYEVDIMYECRICRSVYRSLLNIVSHKRAFCKEKVNVTAENKFRDDHSKSSNVASEDLQSLEVDESTFEMLEKPTKNGRILRSQAPGKAQKKDLTSIVHMLQKKQEENADETTTRNQSSKVQVEKGDCDQVVLQVMESKRAAFQTLVEPNLSSVDLMENQVMELDNMINQDTVTIGTDGLIEPSDSPVHFYSNEEENYKLVCEICYRQFATRKTLNFHMKILHAPDRVCYLCPLTPCSSETFANPASVKRHLTNVHKKIGKELKELGEKIEERIVRTKPLPVLANKKAKKPESPSNNTNEESQVWIEPVDSQVEFHDCGLCGEKFSSKREFMIHSESCIGKSGARTPEKIAPSNQVLLDDDEDCEVISSTQENFVEPTSPQTHKRGLTTSSPIIINTRACIETEDIQFMPIRVQGVSSLNLEDWEKLPEWSAEDEEPSNRVNPTGISLPPEVTLTLKRPNKPTITEFRVLDIPEVIFTNMDNTKKRKMSSLTESNGQISSGESWKKANKDSDLPTVESDRSSAQNLEAKIASISDQTKLECIPCKRSFTSLSSLQRHLESHIKLNRYRCNKCDYKSGTRNDCIGHCNRVHNAMNNRQVLNEMISTIPQDQVTISQEVDLSNLNMFEMSRSSSDMDSRRNMTPVKNLLQKQHHKPINPSDTETEPDDGESLQKIGLKPNMNEIMEIIGGSNSTVISLNPSSNVNGVKQSQFPNNNLDKSSKITDYSPALGEIDYNTNYPDEEDEISCEFYPRSRSNSRMSKSRASKRSESRCGSRMETRSTSRLGKKLDTDDEDEITSELFRSRSRNGNRTRSRSRNQSTIITRSRSRLGNQSDSNLGEEENEEDPWKGYSKDLSTEDNESRSRSRIERRGNSARGRSLSRQSRGKRRGRPPGRGRKNRSTSRGRLERSESLSSESSQMQRPVRNRIKHVDKDFVYDLEEGSFGREASYSPRSSSEKKSSNANQFSQDRFNSSSTATKRLFDSETDDLEFIREIPRSSSSSDLENSELNFRGFPRQT